MKILIPILLVLCIRATAFPSDTVPIYRKQLVAGSHVVLGLGSVAALNAMWYADFPKSKFHTFNDANNWLYMDKVGHAFTAYSLSSLSFQSWKWAGVSQKRAAYLSAGSAWTYQLAIECLDGFSSEWGFSFADVSANTFGAALFLIQQNSLHEQRFQMKYGYRSSKYAALRPTVLGANFPEKLLKDYNAQSYWLCFSPGSFGKVNFPSWLQLAFGYSIDGRLKGDASSYAIQNTTYYSHPEYAFSVDIDWRKLPIKNRRLQQFTRLFTFIKIPFPALYWRNGVAYVGLF